MNIDIKDIVTDAIRKKIRTDIDSMDFDEEIERYIDEADFDVEISMAINSVIEDEIESIDTEALAFDIAVEEIRESLR